MTLKGRFYVTDEHGNIVETKIETLSGAMERGRKTRFPFKVIEHETHKTIVSAG